MIGQWSAEFRAAYPSAKLLIADDQNWDRENRRTFVNKIATGDWDSVIIRAESFKMIPMSPEYQQEFFWKKIAEYQEILNATDSAYKKSRSVKDLEKAIVKYKDKIKELSDMERDEGVIPFDKLGVDHLFIDEADLYKNLEYYTQLQNVRGLGTPKGSERALDMLMKIRHIQENDGGITFATGTPVSNTLVEAYTMQRFLQPEVLKANGLEAFDEWARQYAESVTQMELNNTGTGYTPVTRFSKIVNVPELVTSLRQTWDIQTARNLEASGILVPGINLPRMRIVNEAAPSTPLLRSYLKFLEQREKELKGKPEKGSDNILSIMTDGRKAAIDMRLINPHLPDDPNSKLNLGVKVIHDVYSRFKSEGYTCAVFFDKARSFDPSDPSRVLFDGVKEMKNKLISQGIRPEEIGDVRECKSFDERRALFEKVNDGRVRVIFGSTETMGAGTNFQTNLKAIVHVDAPWRPRDIEQQNGRGYRPGNRTGELEVYNLVTKGSLDTGLWNVLETKAGSIRQVMDGSDKTTRQIEENYYGSVKELSIDNELMKEAVELDHSLRKLKSQNRSHVNEVAHAHRMLQSIPADIDKDEAQIAKIKADMGMRQAEAKGDEFRVILDGKEISERKDAGLFIKATAQTMFLQAKTKGDNIEKGIGSYSGMNLVLRTALYDPYSIGRIIACGQNFRYSAEIRTDSDPVGLCRSLHNQIYRGMEKMLEQFQNAIVMKRANLKEFSRLSQAVFPKQKELEDKEKRYAEVLKLLESESKEKGPETFGDKVDIPWSRLSEMSPEEVHDSVRFFLEANSIEPVPETVDNISGISDLEKAVRVKYSINLPPSVLSTIVSGVNKGQIGFQSIYSDICATIEKTRSTGFTWQMPEKADRYAVFSKDPSKSSPGDVVVRKVTAEAEERFDAYRILEGGVSKFLGSEREFEGMRRRVENYVVCWEVRGRVLLIDKGVLRKNLSIELQI